MLAKCCRRRWLRKFTIAPVECRCWSKNLADWHVSLRCSNPQEWQSFTCTAAGTRELPATLQELVLARLDQMSGKRDVAQLAATLGREFDYDLLAAVVTVDEQTLRTELAKLVSAGILYATGQPPHAPTFSSMC